jgi:DNA polymerase elongation subunit (family B)
MLHEVLAILAEAHDFESYVCRIEAARIVLARYQERLSSGDVDIQELVVSKRITKEPRDYQKAGVTAIAAQQLFGNGVKLRPGQTVEYVITNSECSVPNDRGLSPYGRDGSVMTVRNMLRCYRKRLNRLCCAFLRLRKRIV